MTEIEIAETETSKNRGRQRAQRIFIVNKCNNCETVDKRLERHHKDGNTLNNNPLNIDILCTKCHMEKDGRLEKLRERMRLHGRRKPKIYKGIICKVNECDRKAKYRYFCSTHYYRWLLKGDPGSAYIRPYKRRKNV